MRRAVAVDQVVVMFVEVYMKKMVRGKYDKDVKVGGRGGFLASSWIFSVRICFLCAGASPSHMTHMR